MAAKKKKGEVVPDMYRPPTPQERLRQELDMAAEQAAVAHPSTQRLKEKIRARLEKAAMPQQRNGTKAAAKKKTNSKQKV